MSDRESIRLSYGIGATLILTGTGFLFVPNLIYTAILTLSAAAALINGVFKLFKGIRTKHTFTLLYALLSFAFAWILISYRFIPEWVIRVSFGAYCLINAVALFIQQIIYISDYISTLWFAWLLAAGYILTGSLLLFFKGITTQMLLRFFGLYFILLGLRYFIDGKEMEDVNYTWKRNLHLSLPAPIEAILPDISLNMLNRLFNYRLPLRKRTTSIEGEALTPGLLSLMVHIGPSGFQKVGHFTFSYKGIVYSYGNYDKESERLKGLVGDGVYFMVPKEVYVQNLRKFEQNTIIEYSVMLTARQQQVIESMLKRLHDNSFRWYCQQEKSMESVFLFEKDYPSRLHYRTGAKFYKIKKGRFKTYYLLGDNCVLFADYFLGVIGADVLSLRGFVSPGTYYDYLQQEALKEGSPIEQVAIWRPL